MAVVVLCTHPPLSAAVQRCCDARNLLIERDRNLTPEQLPDPPTDPKDIAGAIKFQSDTMILIDSLDQNLAYRAAMPEPRGRRNIKNFIACVTHGIAIGAINSDEARNMLSAARAATANIARHKKPKDRKKPVLAVHPQDLQPGLETTENIAI